MSKQEMTDWFPYDVKPVHVGEYEVRNSRPIHWTNPGRLMGRNRRYWDGKRWLTMDPNIFLPEISIMGTHETHQWRGLASPPQAKAA